MRRPRNNALAVGSAVGSTALPSGGASRRSVAAIALAAVATTLAYWSPAERGAQWAGLSTPRGSLRVLVASDSAGRSHGLSHRDDLPGDGMLLQWNAPGRHPIWMADMRFPLDLVWLEPNGLVAGVLTNVPVCSSQPCPLYEPPATHQSVAVLELAAGTVANHGIELGSLIRTSAPSSPR
jgi:uncharacterized membrane protein (UPF0127 family)